MYESLFNDRDMEQIRRMGITPDKVLSQIEAFKKGTPYLRLNRPCTIGDGIILIRENELKQLISLYEKEAPGRQVVKFVPASGAATRMFKTLIRFSNGPDEIQRDLVTSRAGQGDSDSRELLVFMDGIRRFAFYEDLRAVMAADSIDIDALVDAGRFKKVLDYLLTDKGCDYAGLPKGLIKFHKYPDGSRTAFEEHLVESAGYIRSENGRCILHFTVSPEHRKGFNALLDRVKTGYEDKYGVQYGVGFSVQERSTDTIAVEMDNRPFRLGDGSILFRPAGHGALIGNLNSLNGDIIYIKNIDNVVPDRLKEHTFFWKKVLGGCLIRIQKRIFSYLKGLFAGPGDEKFLKEVLEFAKNTLCVIPSQKHELTSAKGLRDFLITVLNRPVRVCGMVKNVGEPGGGPFWVEARDGSLSLQVVEKAQVDPGSEDQQDILASSTHFNPVDIVCGVRDLHGKPFDLEKYVDPEAVFISNKSKDGRELKALELPGLWNGGMAHWNTVFVEVPLITFAPVKTVNDLLRDEHQ